MFRSIAIVLVLLSSPTVFADNLTKVKGEIEKEFAKITKELQNKDISAYTNSLAPDFVATSPDGKTATREQIINEFKVLSQSMHDLKWKRNITAIKKVGSEYQIETSSHMTATMGGKDKPHAFVFDSQSEDVWEKLHGKWMVHKTHLLKAHATMDGREVPMH